MEKDRVKEGFSLFSADERTVILDALETEERDLVSFVQRLALARRRAEQRWRSDMETDRGRRVLVGARVPRALYLRVKALARARGVSMYRLVLDQLERMCDNESGSNP